MYKLHVVQKVHLIIIIMSHFRVVIRGDPDEEAVLCTEDKTFELRVADTSNALLVAPSLTLPVDSGMEFI